MTKKKKIWRYKLLKDKIPCKWKRKHMEKEITNDHRI